MAIDPRVPTVKDQQGHGLGLLVHEWLETRGSSSSLKGGRPGTQDTGSHSSVDLSHVTPKGFPAHLVAKNGWWEATSHPESAASLERGS